MMIRRLLFLFLLAVLLLSGCSTSDDLSGKTFDVSVRSSPNNPDKYHAIMTLEFLDGKVINHSIAGEEGTYELKDDNFVIQFENENESLQIEFTLKESDKEFSQYSAEIIDSDFQMEDAEQVSKYKQLYLDLPSSHVEIIERQKGLMKKWNPQ